MEICLREAAQFCGCDYRLVGVGYVEENRVRMMPEPCLKRWGDSN